MVLRYGYGSRLIIILTKNEVFGNSNIVVVLRVVEF